MAAKEKPSGMTQKNFYCNVKTKAAISETAARLGISESILIESAILIFLAAPQDTTPPARPPE